MPAKRSAPKGGATNTQKKSRKSNSKDESSGSGSGDEHEHDEFANREPHDYYCINRPFFDFSNENDDKDDDDQLDEDEIIDKYKEGLRAKGNNALKPVAGFPEHRWVAMWETWKLLCEYSRRASYTCPDLFSMHIYNDFNGYGLQELVENMIVAFDNEFKKKNRDEKSLKQMWAVSAATAHWLVTEQLGPWMMMDDGERLQETIGLVGCAFVSALGELDQAGQLKADSPIKDLGLVMSLYLEWGSSVNDCDDGQLDWRKDVIGYGRKAGIDLEATGCHSAAANVKALDKAFGKISPLASSTKADRWGWKKALKAFKGSSRKIGGENYNILKLSRKERAQYAFDGKDPLAEIPEKDLREGNVMLA